jgi:nicotinate-nucleotide--dimethylbenzimidazole phosphoribosyltransferase
MDENRPSSDEQTQDTPPAAWDRAEVDRLLELFRSRRSVRFFENTPVSDEQIRMVLEAGRWAPSASNAQPWIFIVIKDAKRKSDLLSAMTTVGSRVKKEHPDFPWEEQARQMPRDPRLVYNAPVLIAICADLNTKSLRKYDAMSVDFRKELVMLSIAAAIENMMLMAAALGLGSLWMSPAFTEEVERLLHIPPDQRLAAMIPLGYPQRGRTTRSSRRSLESMLCHERLDPGTQG